MRNFLFSLVELFETYKKTNEALLIPPDNCGVIAEKIKQIIKEYNIKDTLKDEKN